MSKKIIVLVVVATLLFVGGLLFWQRQVTSDTSNDTVTKIEQADVKTQTVANKTSARFYSNKKSGLAFTYPSSWGSDSESDTQITLNTDVQSGVRGKLWIVVSESEPQDYTQFLNRSTTKTKTLNGIEWHFGKSLTGVDDQHETGSDYDAIGRIGSRYIIVWAYNNPYPTSDSTTSHPGLTAKLEQDVVNLLPSVRLEGALPNKPPVISTFTGPTNIRIGEKGTWKAEVKDPEGEAMRYVVRWGDEPSPGDLVYPFNWPGEGYATEYQTSSFDHTYHKAGVYTAYLAVVDGEVNHVADKQLVITVTD